MSLNTKKVTAFSFENETEVSEQSRQLAKRLSGYMGVEAALKIAEENSWSSVAIALREIQGQP